MQLSKLNKMPLRLHLGSIKIPQQWICKDDSKIVNQMSGDEPPWDDYKVIRSEGKYIE